MSAATRQVRMQPSAPPAVYDGRVDIADGTAAAQAFVKHQALMRAYQARYVLLPSDPPPAGVLAHLNRHYAPERIADLARKRAALEAELIAPLVGPAGSDLAAYTEAMLAEIDAAPQNPFVAFLETADHRDDHYRNFLVQSAPDLLAEASASALGVVGEFGEPQSALFRILIDEFGYGSHPRKHSVLYRAAMRSFDLVDEYNGYWPLFDTAALRTHNVIHYLFQNPAHIFRQIGFLLYAEAAYQRSTAAHFRYLRAFHPGADARYFGEHAHIDQHHSRMIIDEVAAPLAAKFGPEVEGEIILGAELTRRTFREAGDHLQAVSAAFASAGQVSYGLPGDIRQHAGRAVTPASDLDSVAGPILVGAIGTLADPRAFAAFPPDAIGRVLLHEAAA